MRNDRDKVIERIRKLLAMNEERGATESEAVAAALAAQKLMAEHDVEAWELAGEAEPIEKYAARKTRRWQLLLAAVVAENFRCRCYIDSAYEGYNVRRTSYVVFFGYRHDAEAAKLVFERLAAVGNREGSRFAKRRKAELQADSHRPIETKPLYEGFCTQFVAGVRSVLEKQSEALMIVVPPRVSEAYESFARGFGKASYRPNVYRGEDYSDGYRAGRDAVNSGRLGGACGDRLLEA